MQTDLNGCSENPVALTARDATLSGGAYFTAYLTNAEETVSRAFVHLDTAPVARMAKLMNPEFSGMPLFLAASTANDNGFAPFLKTAEALLAELLHEAQPAANWPSVSANGAEDVLTSSPVAVRALGRITAFSLRLSAIELMIAAQGVELRGDAAKPGPVLAATLATIRSISAPLADARPLGHEIERLGADNPFSDLD